MIDIDKLKTNIIDNVLKTTKNKNNQPMKDYLKQQLEESKEAEQIFQYFKATLNEQDKTVSQASETTSELKQFSADVEASLKLLAERAQKTTKRVNNKETTIYQAPKAQTLGKTKISANAFNKIDTLNSALSAIKQQKEANHHLLSAEPQAKTINESNTAKKEQSTGRKFRDRVRAGFNSKVKSFRDLVKGKGNKPSGHNR